MDNKRNDNKSGNYFMQQYAQRCTLRTLYKSVTALALALSLSTISIPAAVAEQANASAEPRPLELTDIMKFREISQRQFSDDGDVFAFSAEPDYGDNSGHVVLVDEGTTFDVERADRPQLSSNGQFTVFRQQPSLFEREKAKSKEEKEALKNNAVLVNNQNGEQTRFEDARTMSFTGDGRFFIVLQNTAKDDDAEDKPVGHTLRIVNLSDMSDVTVDQVSEFSVAEKGARLVWLTEGTDEQAAQVVMYNTATSAQQTIATADDESFHNFSFAPEGMELVFLSESENEELKEIPQHLYHWRAGNDEAVVRDTTREGWILSKHSPLRWSEDGKRLFIGHRPYTGEKKEKAPGVETEDDLYDLERLTSDRRLQVWHGDDARILTHQRESFDQMKRATALSVIHLESSEQVALSSDPEFQLSVSDHPHALIARDARPYLREITWNGFYHDLYHVDLETGAKTRIDSRLISAERGSISPDGRYVAYVHEEELRLFDARTGDSVAVAQNADVSWVDEENDRPMEAYQYGIGGWLEDSSAFFAYDRFDIWQVNVHGDAQNLTQVGRDQQRQYRIVAPEDGEFSADDQLLVRGYHEQLKTSGFYALDINNQLLKELIEGKKTYRLVNVSEDESRYFFTEEDLRQFPDVWVTDAGFTQRRQLTNVNPQRDEFIWGNAELVEWESQIGVPLQGILIKPDNYDPNKRYPVMVYFYEKFSQRLYQWNQMKVNHRPNFPYYVGQDYVVFLPDVHFRIGAPGPSATESLVPAMEKIIDMGVADPDAIGLHGHSWSGYQAAHIVTETDIFAAVVSGAPVSNMTSAYSGIRWGSGLARQFQYEQGQSRLGVPLVENMEPYIKNSPVFFADKVNTPMVIQFGDEDGAVPWEQGIEYYLALRRFNKPVVMLHYEGEPHHLQRFANKIDYTIKMREFFDYYLKGEDAPDWWTEGMSYQSYD